MNFFIRHHGVLVLGTAVAAAFFLFFRGGTSIKAADLLFAVAGLFIFAHASARQQFVDFLASHRRYLRWLIGLLLFFFVAQCIGYFGQNIIPNMAVAHNYARVIFNGMLFIFVAYLIYTYENSRLLTYISLAIIIAPVVLLLAYTKYGNWENFTLLSGGRLTGFLENPILLCMWLAVVFLVGMGFFLEAKKWWLKAIIIFWLSAIANFILWSASRAAWFSLAVSLGVWMIACLLYNRQKFKFLFVGVFFAFALGYVTLPNHSINKMQPWVGERAVEFISHPLENQIRTSFWRSATPFALKNVLGLGLLNSSGLQPNYMAMINGQNTLVSTPSNTFLEVMFYGGLGALATFLLFLFEIGKDARSVLKQVGIRGLKDLEIAWLLATPLVFMDIFFNDGFLLRFTWFVLGMTLGVILRYKKRPLFL